MGDFKDLVVYQKAYRVSMEIFEISKSFPHEEKYSLTSQIRKSSRSVCANLAEAYRKRRYPKHFTGKITDAVGESSETTVWLDFAYACNYIDTKTWQRLLIDYQEVGKILGFLSNHPEKFIPLQ